MVSTAVANPLMGLGAGELATIPIRADGTAGTARPFWQSGVGEAPDGFTFAASGDIFLALLGPLGNQVVQLDPTGRIKNRLPTAQQNSTLDPPFDAPTSVTYDGDRLLVTNGAFFDGNRSHQVVYDIAADQPGSKPFSPSTRPTSAPAPEHVVASITPKRLIARRRTTARVHVELVGATGRHPAPSGTVVRLGPTRATVHVDGRTKLRVRPQTAGHTWHLRAATPGTVPARISIPVVASSAHVKHRGRGPKRRSGSHPRLRPVPRRRR